MGKKYARKRISHLTVGDFFEKHGEALKLELQGKAVGFDRKIIEPTVNHPGLALAGFLSYFAYKRVQVLGTQSSPISTNVIKKSAYYASAPFVSAPFPVLLLLGRKRLALNFSR